MKIIIKPTGSRRLFRSGGWDSAFVSTRVASRLWLDPGSRDNTLGLRLIMVIK